MSVCLFSEESFVVMDYATPENVEVVVAEEVEGRMSPPAKNSSNYFLSFKLLMSKNSEGRAEQISLVAESRYCTSRLFYFFFFIINCTNCFCSRSTV